MRYIRLDVDIFRSAKVAGLSDKEKIAYLRALCWCGERENDGHIDDRVLPEIHVTRGMAGRLVAAGLWEANGDGWVIHDFLKHQQSKGQLDENRDAMAERQRRARERRKEGEQDEA